MTTFKRLIAHSIASLGMFFSFALVAHAASCAGGQSGSLCNPSVYPDITSFIAGALKAMVQIALPIIAVFVVLSGFYFISARGNSESLKKARMNFLYVVIGALLILGAWVLATLIGGTVTQVVG